MELILFFVGGCIFGLITGAGLVALLALKKSGALVIDSTDEDGPYMFLELTEKPDRLMKRKAVILTVQKRGYFE